MTAAKLLSAIEPIIRYQRGRFRGGEGTAPGSPRYEFGLQLKEDTLHRLIDIWATGEASAALGFAAARLFDQLDPLERLKNEKFAAAASPAGTATCKPCASVQRRQRASNSLACSGVSGPHHPTTRWSNSPCSTPWPTCSAPPASSGTPATAPV